MQLSGGTLARAISRGSRGSASSESSCGCITHELNSSTRIFSTSGRQGSCSQICPSSLCWVVAVILVVGGGRSAIDTTQPSRACVAHASWASRIGRAHRPKLVRMARACFCSRRRSKRASMRTCGLSLRRKAGVPQVWYNPLLAHGFSGLGWSRPLLIDGARLIASTFRTWCFGQGRGCVALVLVLSCVASASVVLATRVVLLLRTGAHIIAPVSCPMGSTRQSERFARALLLHKVDDLAADQG